MTGEPAMPRRLVSLDALRGLDMLVIVGGAAVVRELARTTEHPVLATIAHQLEHVEWHGFLFYDLVFPLFLFLSGATLPLTVERRVAAGGSRGQETRSALRRGLVLVLLGAVYNGALRLDGEPVRWASVLGRIGLGWTGAALACIWLSLRAQIGVAVGILLGYWALLAWAPVPGFGAGDLTPGHTFTDWVDQHLLPGRLYKGDRDPEGLLGTVPSVATALMGAFAGRWLLRGPSCRGWRALGLIGAGAVALLVAGVWDAWLPLNKNLWTSSFALWCAGWSSLLLGAFHFACDRDEDPGLALPLVVIGMNPITIYLLRGFVDFPALSELLLNPLRISPLAGALLLEWLLLYALYRRRWFLRV
ncbi:MAG: DUF5009 domain-containing protein [Planctomycetes bacterium]|nr:DUF5009 domain-containing protein [Planctomycetota bacterium]